MNTYFLGVLILIIMLLKDDDEPRREYAIIALLWPLVAVAATVACIFVSGHYLIEVLNHEPK